jgi:UDP-N-acetylmuramoyl-tripeptide--D-alanyl-D-alanine ligase
MDELTLGRIREWTRAEVLGIFRANSAVASICIDTRQIQTGDLYVALQGLNYDGHDYIAEAFERGAVGAIVNTNYVSDSGLGPIFVVESPLRALGKIAQGYRSKFQIPVICITGSSGKTTTKEMVASVLEKRFNVLKSTGSENNEVGVPKTLLKLNKRHDVVVLEFAARRQGDIKYLCNIAQPTFGILLNIGTAHLEYFESLEGVAKAKGELLEYLDESLIALINADDRVVCQEVQRTKGRLLTFGFQSESIFRGERLILDQESCGHFLFRGVKISLKIPGKHNAYNALAALSVGAELGVKIEHCAEILSRFQAVEKRSEVIETGEISVVNDCYNANPESMRAALDVLQNKVGSRKVAILGDMLELGSNSESFHVELGLHVATIADELITIGPMAKYINDAARGVGHPNVSHFENTDSVIKHLNNSLVPGDIVLVKASQGMGLSRIVEAIS